MTFLSSIIVKKLVHPVGFEPTALGFGSLYSIQLSYECVIGIFIQYTNKIGYNQL